MNSNPCRPYVRLQPSVQQLRSHEDVQPDPEGHRLDRVQQARRQERQTPHQETLQVCIHPKSFTWGPLHRRQLALAE